MRFCENPNGCQNPVFSTDKLTRKGYCKPCANKFRTDIDRRTIIQRAMSKQKTLNSKIRGLNVPEIDENANKLELFYMSAAVELRNKPFCCECNAFVPEKFFRAATAHVLPKRKVFGFPSIAYHPENRIFLGSSCGCHQNYDSAWSNASQMKIWPIAVEKFKILYEFIALDELKNLPTILLETLIVNENSA